jgi:hypothetical protein
MFTKARKWQSWDKRYQASSDKVALRSKVILFFHLHLVLRCDLPLTFFDRNLQTFPPCLAFWITVTVIPPPPNSKRAQLYCKVDTLRPFVLLVRVALRCRWLWSIGGMVLTGETEALGEKHYTASVVDEWMSTEQWWNGTDRGNWSTGRKTCHSANLSTTNFTRTDLGSNPDLRCERPTTKCLNHGTTLVHLGHVENT